MADEPKPALLVSDAEREEGIALLRAAVVEGRLTLEEFGMRDLGQRRRRRDVRHPGHPGALQPAGSR